MPMRLASLLHVGVGEHFSSGRERQRRSPAADRFFQRQIGRRARFDVFKGKQSWRLKHKRTAARVATMATEALLCVLFPLLHAFGGKPVCIIPYIM